MNNSRRDKKSLDINKYLSRKIYLTIALTSDEKNAIMVYVSEENKCFSNKTSSSQEIQKINKSPNHLIGQKFFQNNFR